MTKRLKMITDAATLLFLRQGYAKTQISHIAKAAGISVGTIYLDFAGKEEIMHFLLKSTIEQGFSDREFEKPITDDLFDGLEDEITALFKKSAEKFAEHLEDPAGGYSFEALISDTFDMLSRYAVDLLFIEKNQFDFKKLAEQYILYRTHFFDTMMRYINTFISQGTVRPLENSELSTMLIIEILSWWAMDVHYTTFEPRNISASSAKSVCMDNIIAAYKRQN
jgi:AcrR family transcriptional regulator